MHLMYKGKPGPGALWVASFLQGTVSPLLKPWVPNGSALVGAQGCPQEPKGDPQGPKEGPQVTKGGPQGPKGSPQGPKGGPQVPTGGPYGPGP